MSLLTIIKTSFMVFMIVWELVILNSPILYYQWMGNGYCMDC